MARIKAIPGIMWASDILTGQKRIPDRKQDKPPEQESGDGFKEIFDQEIRKRGSNHEREQTTDRDPAVGQSGNSGGSPEDPELVF
jgi:hypothetical protein